jgi:uncharacterized protein YgbK (DUF1537 family)
MAGTKRRATKKTIDHSERVMVALDVDTILTINAAVEALAEFAAAIIKASDDPAVNGHVGKTSKKAAKKKRARKAV